MREFKILHYGSFIILPVDEKTRKNEKKECKYELIT